jgi:hypothetical protein
MQLSVLSALARMDVDLWEEAACLAVMPRAIVEKILVDSIGSSAEVGTHRKRR